MIVEYIRYKIEDSKQEAFVEAYQEAAKYLAASPYCLGYELTHSEEEFRDFLQHVRPYFNDIEEMNHYELTKVVKQIE